MDHSQHTTRTRDQPNISSISPQELKDLERAQNALVNQMHEIIGDQTKTIMNTTIVLYAHKWSKSNVTFHYNDLLSKVLEKSDEIPEGFYLSQCLRPTDTENAQFAKYPINKSSNFKCSLCSKERKESNCRNCSSCNSDFCCECFETYTTGVIITGACLLLCPAKKIGCVGVVRSEYFLGDPNESQFQNKYVMKSHVEEKYKRNLSNSFLMSPAVRFCLLQGCHKMTILSDDDEYNSDEDQDEGNENSQFFKKLCVECHKIPEDEICVKCRSVAHDPVPCNLLDYWMNFHHIEKFAVIGCPNCGEKVFRSDKPLLLKFVECAKCKLDFCVKCTSRLGDKDGAWSVHKTGNYRFHKLEYECKDTTMVKKGNETISVYDGTRKDFESYRNFVNGFSKLQEVAGFRTIHLSDMNENLYRGKNILFFALRMDMMSSIVDMILENHKVPSGITKKLGFLYDFYVDNSKKYFEKKKKMTDLNSVLMGLLRGMTTKKLQDVSAGEVEGFFKTALILMKSVQDFSKHVAIMTVSPIKQIQFNKRRDLMRITVLMKNLEWLKFTNFQVPHHNVTTVQNKVRQRRKYENPEDFNLRRDLEKAKELSKLSLNTSYDEDMKRAMELSIMEHESNQSTPSSSSSSGFVDAKRRKEMEEIIRHMENFVSRSTETVTEVIKELIHETLRNEKLQDFIFDTYLETLMSYHDNTAQGVDAHVPLEKLTALFRFVQTQTNACIRKKKYLPTGKNEEVEILSHSEVRQYSRKFGIKFNLRMKRGVGPKPQFEKTITFVCGGKDYVLYSEKAKVEWNMAPVVVFSTHPYKHGGNYQRGYRGREEELCRRSNYGEVVCRVNYPIDEFGGVYIKDVDIFRSNEATGYKFMETVSKIDIICCPAIRLSGGENDAKTTLRLMSEKLRTIFRIAIQNEHDAVVMTEWGVGKLRTPPDAVAELISSVVQEFHGYFKCIVFTITESDFCGEENGRTIPSFEKFFGVEKRPMKYAEELQPTKKGK